MYVSCLPKMIKYLPGAQPTGNSYTLKDVTLTR